MSSPPAAFLAWLSQTFPAADPNFAWGSQELRERWQAATGASAGDALIREVATIEVGAGAVVGQRWADLLPPEPEPVRVVASVIEAAPLPVGVSSTPAETRGDYLTPEAARELGVRFQPPPPVIRTESWAENFVDKTPKSLSSGGIPGVNTVLQKLGARTEEGRDIIASGFAVGSVPVSFIPGGETPLEARDRLKDDFDFDVKTEGDFLADAGRITTGAFLYAGAVTAGLFSPLVVDVLPGAVAPLGFDLPEREVYPRRADTARDPLNLLFEDSRSLPGGFTDVADPEVGRALRAQRSAGFTDVADPEVARALRAPVERPAELSAEKEEAGPGQGYADELTGWELRRGPDASEDGSESGPALPGGHASATSGPVLESFPAPVGASLSPVGLSDPSSLSAVLPGALPVAPAAGAAAVGAGAALAGTNMTGIPFLGGAQDIASKVADFARENPGKTAAAATITVLGAATTADLSRGEESLIRTTVRRARSSSRPKKKAKKKAARKSKGSRKPMRRAKSAKAKAPAKKRRREDRTGVTRSKYRGQKVYRTKNGRPYVILKSGPMKGMARFIPQ